MQKKINIALVYGGISKEREVSIRSAQEIDVSLDRKKYNVVRYDIRNELHNLIKHKTHIDLVIPILHGPYGEDGRIQGLFDMLGLKYLFSGASASSLAMNKNLSKIFARSFGVKVARGELIRKNTNIDVDDIYKKYPQGLVVKPNELGSSFAVSVMPAKTEIKKAIMAVWRLDQDAIIEEYLLGRELTVAVIADPHPRALPVIEIIPRVSAWFDYKAKYQKNGSSEVCPAVIPEKIAEKAKSTAIQLFKNFGLSDIARVDYIWNEKADTLSFLEVNTIPGMTKTSLVPKALLVSGQKLGDLLDVLISSHI